MYQNPNPKSYRRIRLFIVGLIAIGLLSAWQLARTHPQLAVSKAITTNQPGLYKVTHVDDGDTIKVTQAGQTETIRFIGMDTPEVKDPRKPVQCYGAEASVKTKSMLTGAKVRLEPDPLGDNRDKYHRLLRYVYLPDGTLMNELLIKDGYAFAYVIFPFSKIDQFKADEASAQAAGIGLWGKCQINTTTQIKQTNPV